MSRREFIVWGVAPGDEHEQPLYTKARTFEGAERVAKLLERAHGCTHTRVQILDLTTPPDFAGTIAGTAGESEQ